ncbi:MAG: DUF4391 domain-containing protein [Gudongella sp.]|nr:DUF4391 domain-containing protein [Gudongella sp.]
MSFYEMFGMPQSCYIGRHIDQEIMLKYAKLNESGKHIVRAYVESIVLQYSLNPRCLGIESYKSKITTYDEIQVLEVIIKPGLELNEKLVMQLSLLLLKSIPYPLLIALNHEDRYCLASAKTRTHKKNPSKNVIEDLIISGWVKLYDFNETDAKMIKEIKNSISASDNLLNLYTKWQDSMKVHFKRFYKDVDYEEELLEKEAMEALRFDCKQAEKEFEDSIKRKQLEYNEYYKYFEDLSREILGHYSENGQEYNFYGYVEEYDDEEETIDINNYYND